MIEKSVNIIKDEKITILALQTVEYIIIHMGWLGLIL